MEPGKIPFIYVMKGRKNWLRIFLIHGVLWSLYVVLEFLANYFHISEGHEWTFIRSTLMSLPVLMVPTYFIALFAVPHFLQEQKQLWFILSILVAGVFVFFARMYWLEWVNYLESGRHFKMPVSKVLKNVIRDYSVVALAVCLYIIGDWRHRQVQNETLIKARAEAELKLLKGQLHPHFLFNTLNNIYSLALLQSEQTADSILKLTDLLDYLVYKAGKQEVLLSREVELLENYLELEKLRYGDKLELETEFKLENEQQKIAPLMLLPFVENSFKHGRSGKDNKFKVSLKLQSTQEKLKFYIEKFKRETPKHDQKNGGVGLKNIHKRLELLYHQKHLLEIDDNGEDFQVKLEIRFSMVKYNC
ncbi:MAG: hypothetical protein DWQ02_27760, partial [Bacteroidetes bacterium]